MAWVTPIGSSPGQIDYRLGQQHGCAIGEAGEVSDAQLAYRTDQERPLIWVGDALADLGIQAGSELTKDQFELARAMVNGYHPRTGEQLVQHKLGVPRQAKVQLAPLVRMIEGVANEARVDVSEVLQHTEGRWVGLASKRMLDMFQRAQRAVERDGELAALRADHAGQLADAAKLSVEAIWGPGVFAAAAANLTKTITVTAPDGTVSEQIVDNRIVVGNLAYDFSVGLHKSLCLLREFADETTGAQLDRIFTQEAMKTFAWLETNTAYGMRGHHGDGQVAETTPGNGFAGWAMIHRSARPTEGHAIGDPHWHVHFTIANMTKGEDGKWSTVAAGGRDLMRHAPAADRLMQASARRVLTERYGITWRRSERTRNWEVESIPDEAIREFSRRGADIKAMLLDLGFTEDTASAAVKRMVAQETRLGKTEAATLPDATLREHYQQRARTAGFDPDALAAAALANPPGGPPPDHNRQPTIAELAALLQNVDTGLTAHTRRFSRIDALCAVADALPTGGSHEQIEHLTDQVLDHAGFVELRRGVGTEASHGEQQQLGADHMTNATLYTTQDVLDAEQVIATAAEHSHDDQTPIRVSAAAAEMAAAAFEAANGFALSAEQHRELLNIVTSGRAVDALIGGPGAGKTTLMDVVRAAYQAEGFVIAGAATGGTAAQNLQAESGIPSRTVAQWLWRIEHGPGLRGVDVLVLDEAGMTNDRDRARLYTAAAVAGTKIVETGDPKQLRGVGCGSMFAVVHRLVGGGALVENRRQADADERAAIAAWRAGNYSEALTSWADRDRLIVGETGQDATAAMLATWMDQRHGAPDPFVEMRGLLMVAATNEQVDRLNAGAQAVRAAQGELGAGRTYELPGGRSIQLREHDYVLVRINERRDGQPDALNGYRGIVDRIHPDGSVAVRWERNTADGRLVEHAVFAPDYLAAGGLTHGYALTIHKSQGLTIGSDGATWTGPDHQQRGGAVLFYAAGADNPGSFVAASRHKLAMWMFLARKDVEGAQDEYLLGIPTTTFDRVRRVITKLVDRAKATEVNANDRPAMVDLGLLDDPDAPPPRHGGPASDRRPRPERTASEHARRRAHRAEKDTADTQRRASATELLTEEWGSHLAVQRVTDGAAFGTVARWLDRIATAGGDPRAALRDIDPDELLHPQIRDASQVTAAALKQTAQADPAATGRRRTPQNRDQRKQHHEQLEQQQRDQAADLLREQWHDHPAAEQVIAGSAFGALTQNLATAAIAGHDPRTVLRSIRPQDVTDKDNPSAFMAWRIRADFLTEPDTQPAGGTSGDRTPQPAQQPPQPADAVVRLDVLVPAYERVLTRLHTDPPAAHDPARIGQQPAAQPPAPPNPATAPRPSEPPRTDTTGQPEPTSPDHEQPAPATRRRDALWPSWLPPAPDPHSLTGRDRSLASAAAADARRIRDRVVELGRDAIRQRPDWVDALGPAPTGAAARTRYLAAISTIAAYREQHGITGPEPLGAPPSGPPPAGFAVARQAREHLLRGRATPPPPTGPDERPTPRPDRGDTARHRAERIAQQQRAQTRPRPADHDPRRQAPGHGHGPAPGVG